MLSFARFCLAVGYKGNASCVLYREFHVTLLFPLCRSNYFTTVELGKDQEIRCANVIERPAVGVVLEWKMTLFLIVLSDSVCEIKSYNHTVIVSLLVPKHNTA